MGGAFSGATGGSIPESEGGSPTALGGAGGTITGPPNVGGEGGEGGTFDLLGCWLCDGPNGRCYHPGCGDGFVEQRICNYSDCKEDKYYSVPDWAIYAEQCDDGNLTIGDGCSDTCTIEASFVCPSGAECRPIVCGDGFWDSGERCEDGNTTPLDGCDGTCVPEPGWNCLHGACRPIVCGDTFRDQGEACDDGNTISLDGCDASCMIEGGWDCGYYGQECFPIACGNGIATSEEECDDGNTLPGDGCSETCDLEPGAECNFSRTICYYQICGDGVVTNSAINGDERCDDGNILAGDGCNEYCHRETGWECPTSRHGGGGAGGEGGGAITVGAPCRRSVCGDGAVESGERCDDGNTTANDGCSADCGYEPGWTCDDGTACRRMICGNGLVDIGERCDDGNAASGDGCSATCTIEPGWSCPYPRHVCFEKICGNSITEPFEEQCDDGNDVSGDGCDRCKVEGRACERLR
jgi:cysteine-rich repeat protein